LKGSLSLRRIKVYKEIERLISKSNKGEEESKEELIKRLQPLIISSIRRYYNKVNEYDDLIQEGNLVVLQCLENYDKNKGTYFLGYVKTMLKFTYLNKHKEKICFSINQPVNDGEGELVDILESKGESPLDLLLEKENYDLLYEALNILTDRQREVVIYFYVEDLSIGQIAEKLNITYRTVINTKTRALEKLKEYFKIEQ
jgi:RNA polymerase sporulation-specific sigma factor